MRERLMVFAIFPVLTGCLDTAGSSDRSASTTMDTLTSEAIAVSNSNPGLWGDSVPRLVETRKIYVARYLGTVRPPVELEALRPPVTRGDTISGITTDDVGAQYVVELHLERAG